MKFIIKTLFILFIVFRMTASAHAEERGLPFDLKYYGNFKKMVHMKKVEGVVDLKAALNGKHIYALGAIKNAEGEITVYDGKVWLSYGKDGIDKVTHEIPDVEQATVLLIGFYSADIQGVFTHPGESWHTHVIIKDENKAGHVEKFGVSKGSVLKLPVL